MKTFAQLWRSLFGPRPAKPAPRTDPLGLYTRHGEMNAYVPGGGIEQRAPRAPIGAPHNRTRPADRPAPRPALPSVDPYTPPPVDIGFTLMGLDLGSASASDSSSSSDYGSGSSDSSSSTDFGGGGGFSGGGGGSDF